MNLRAFILLLFFGIFPGLARGAEPQRVLVLFVNARLNPGVQRGDEAFRSALVPEGNQSPMTLFIEFLDVIRFL